MLAVRIRHLIKRYGKVLAVDNFSLEIEEGMIYGLLGPNGAGKTTTIHTLVGLCKKTSGETKVFGMDCERDYLKVRSCIGFVPQEIVNDNFFTVEQLLTIQSGLYGLQQNRSRIEEVMEKLKLTRHRKKRMPELSGGMKRRLMVAKALVHSPRLLILDEPTAGVDVHLRQSLWEYVAELNREGMTILLTTHYLEEAEKMCQKVSIIHKGREIASGSPSELIQGFGEKTVDFHLSKPLEKIPEQLLSFDPQRLKDNQILRVHLKKDQTMRDLLLAAKNGGIAYYDLHIQQGDLEDVFLKLTQ